MERFRQDPGRGEGGVSSGSDVGSAPHTGGAQRVSALSPPSLGRSYSWTLSPIFTALCFT